MHPATSAAGQRQVVVAVMIFGARMKAYLAVASVSAMLIVPTTARFVPTLRLFAMFTGFVVFVTVVPTKVQ
jgi:hypothetical protein